MRDLIWIGATNVMDGEMLLILMQAPFMPPQGGLLKWSVKQPKLFGSVIRVLRVLLMVTIIGLPLTFGGSTTNNDFILEPQTIPTNYKLKTPRGDYVGYMPASGGGGPWAVIVASAAQAEVFSFAKVA